MEIDVDLMFNDEGDGEPTFFVSEDGSLKWRYEDVEMCDWKDKSGRIEALRRLMKRAPVADIVILIDGTDSFIYALRSEAIEG